VVPLAVLYGMKCLKESCHKLCLVPLICVSDNIAASESQFITVHKSLTSAARAGWGPTKDCECNVCCCIFVLGIQKVTPYFRGRQ
jgi:hypothetical protein